MTSRVASGSEGIKEMGFALSLVALLLLFDLAAVRWGQDSRFNLSNRMKLNL